MQHPNTWYLPWGMPLQKMVAVPIHPTGHLHLQTPAVHMQPMLAGLPAPLTTLRTFVSQPTAIRQPQRKIRKRGFWWLFHFRKSFRRIHIGTMAKYIDELKRNKIQGVTNG
ncbi:hypothetical protein ABEB36_002864 [Hypothenemus hampei]|uniref:Uncharacterized protein n=1 Tax=Hypothenemus hampei TaxID=57062 RepID=A0ABD1F798_HYPHA